MKLIFNLPEGKVEEFTVDKSIVTIGRGNVCDVVLPFEGFSRKHAQIELAEGEIFVTDLGSTNGVYIDGSRITPGVRTQMQSFLTLQIGPAQQVEVIDDYQVIPERPIQSQARERTRSQIQRKEISEHTKTTQMDPKLLKKNPEKAKKETSDSQNKMSMILLPIIILGGAIYYFYFMNTDAPEEIPQVPQGTQSSVAPLTEVNFLSAAIIESQFANKSCSAEMARWCTDAGILAENNEGVVIAGKALLVYMNLNLYKDDKFHENFNALPEDQKLEILTLRRIFTSTVIRTLSRQTALDTIQVASGMVGSEGFSPRLALKIQRDIDLKKADKFLMYDVFDRIINEGKTQDLSEISPFYQKLPLK